MLVTSVSSSARVIFLGGLGRSGTTLLERLLGEVPGVTALGEVVHLWARGVVADESCGCGEPFSRCPFWKDVGDRAFGGWPPELAAHVAALRDRVDRTRRIPALARAVRTRPPAGGLADYTWVYRRLYDAASAASGGSVVIDSSKHASLAYCLAAGGLDVHVVQVVRDPRAVAHSWHRRVARPEDGTPMMRWAPARTSLHWAAQNLSLELLARCGVPVTRVRYEDLVEAPREAVGGLAATLGLPTGPGSLDFIGDGRARLSVAHTASGNPMRFAVGPLPLTPDDRWRTSLVRRHRRTVTALTWPLMARYGYGEGAA
ncbi:hypothetical protein SAMN05421505_112173 [Sinosporangium album]|uniref:Sulfotransferase family protein n=1 Tax=Sinosporangium album TaxID=504805 RepID=A0A1G8AIE1_9ACTN|nr:sulfotransferase [Sinosporangium album]SDH20659.1 hypothetical protein SAMN05421505_112173 [Sinosporangium album]